MFGFSFGELAVLVIVAIVLIGPKDMPKLLRRLGQWSGKIRRMATDLRAQSGIDDVLRGEGIGADIAEIRKLARGELDPVTRTARFEGVTHEHTDPYAFTVERAREHPAGGPDSYGALPDDAVFYAGTLPASAHAQSPLYVHGDADAAIAIPPAATPHDEPDHEAAAEPPCPSPPEPA